MAYTLQSLVQSLEQDYRLILANNPQIEYLLKKAYSLINLAGQSSIVATGLESRIRDAAHNAQDTIECHITDQVLLVSEGQASELDLTDVLEEFDSIELELSQILKAGRPAKQVSPVSAASSRVNSINDIVGFDEDVDVMVHKSLINIPASPQKRIAITGMGGTGKTAFALKVYNNASIVGHFDVRLWVTVSQEVNLRVILFALLDSLIEVGLIEVSNDMQQESDKQLVDYVYQTLVGKRYLIVLDDIWEVEHLAILHNIFPGNNNRSAFLFTTRLNHIASSIGCDSYGMKNLNDVESWKLLRQEMLRNVQYIPHELVKTGKNIACKCGGFPLAIIEIGKLLSMSMKAQHWEKIEKNYSSTASLCTFDTFLMSYNHLPFHLKLCFLYMGAFPKNNVIKPSKISKLWIAEGFVPPKPYKELEDVANMYFTDLLDHQVLEFCINDVFGKAKGYKLHDLWWEFCQRKAVEEKFFWLQKFHDNNSSKDPKPMRCVSFHSLSQHSNEMKPMFDVRSFLCIGLVSQHLAPKILRLRMLKILDVFQLEFNEFPSELVELVLLKFLALSCHLDVPSSISRLCNMQTLILRRLPSLRTISLPSEMWEMTQLRHIKSKGTYVWYYPRYEKAVVQENLQTLSNIEMFVVTNEFLEMVPNLRKMGIFCNTSICNDVDLGRLLKLESLRCSSNWSRVTGDFLSYLKLPRWLRKLTLSMCRIPLEFMPMVGSLPNLEELKVQKSDFLGIKWVSVEQVLQPTEPQWKTADGEFPKLKSLLMEDLNLVCWRVDLNAFQSLEHLVIRGCLAMEKIPSSTVDLPALERIEVDENCSESLLKSAIQIKQELIDSGNDLLQVVIHTTDYLKPI